MAKKKKGGFSLPPRLIVPEGFEMADPPLARGWVGVPMGDPKAPDPERNVRITMREDEAVALFALAKILGPSIKGPHGEALKRAAARFAKFAKTGEMWF